MILGGTILFHEIVLMEQPNKTLRSSLRLELSIAPLEKLLDLVPNGTSQFQYFGTRLAPHGEHLSVGYNTLTMLLSHSFRVPGQHEARKAMRPAPKLDPPRPTGTEAPAGQGPATGTSKAAPITDHPALAGLLWCC